MRVIWYSYQSWCKYSTYKLVCSSRTNDKEIRSWTIRRRSLNLYCLIISKEPEWVNRKLTIEFLDETGNNHFHTHIRMRWCIQAAGFEDGVLWNARATATNPGVIPYGCGRVSAFGFVQSQNELVWMNVRAIWHSKWITTVYGKVIVWPRQASSTGKWLKQGRQQN